MSLPAEISFPPAYYAVIFTTRHAAPDDPDYAATARRMEELARRQPGFLGLESARDADGFGITVSYWRSLDDIAAWKRHAEHQVAQNKGRRRWYDAFALRVAKVERASHWRR